MDQQIDRQTDTKVQACPVLKVKGSRHTDKQIKGARNQKSDGQTSNQAINQEAGGLASGEGSEKSRKPSGRRRGERASDRHPGRRS